MSMTWPKNIGEYAKGSVVRHKQNELVGHVIRFDLNPQNEVLIVVAFAGRCEAAYHPSSIIPL